MLVNPADVLRWNSHKGYLAEFTAKGVPTVPTRLVPGPSTDVADQVREVPWEEIVVKPAIDGGARHAWRGLRDDPSLSRVAERLTDHGDVVVQPFVPAIVDGERSLVFLGGRFSHAVRKVPKPGTTGRSGTSAAARSTTSRTRRSSRSRWRRWRRPPVGSRTPGSTSSTGRTRPSSSSSR